MIVTWPQRVEEPVEGQSANGKWQNQGRESDFSHLTLAI
jgi:hypothetical protein